jgi:hypothetical protein
MKILTRILFIIFFLYSFTLFAQKDTTYIFGEDQGEIEYFFGFNLIPSATGGLVHYVLIKPGEIDKRIIRQITKDDFVYQAAGKQESLANPKKINFFKQYQIDNPNVIDDLWRLRYKEYPYFTKDQMPPGWSSNDSIPFLPTETQMKTLEKFGLYKLSDYIYGENAFKLLYLMGKPEWVKSYKESY